METGNPTTLAPGCNEPCRHLDAGGLVRDLGDAWGLRVLHAWWWSFDAGWRMGTRRVPNGMLYLPLASRIRLRVDAAVMEVGPGGLAVLPEGLEQEGWYAPGADGPLRALVVHLVAPDRQGLDLLRRFPSETHDLPGGWSAWEPRLTAALQAFNSGSADGAAHATAVVRLLLIELAIASAPRLRPAPALDPRVLRALDRARGAAPGSLAVEDLAAAAGLGPRRFRDLFAAALGTTPKDWLVRQRLAEAARRLRDPGRTVKSVAVELGYPSDHDLHAAFRRVYGMTPSAWRRAGAGG